MAKNIAKPWHEVVRVRADIRSEELSLKAFAADLYDVMLDRNVGVYHDPQAFFSLTYPTLRLRELARDVTRRLAGKSDKAVRQLHVTFGGGKTHALIALVQLVRDPAALPDVPAVQEFRTHCDLGEEFPKARVAAVVFDRLDAEQGMEVKSPDGATAKLKMPWSLIAWQLAGKKGLKLLKDDGSERESPPATNVMEQLLELAREEAPSVLILFDEVLWFVRTMADQDPAWIRRMADFLHSLTQAVSKISNACLVASLLASETSKMDDLGKRISKELYDEFKRVADDGIQPVEIQDVPEILRRRLFEIEGDTDRSVWRQQVMAALNRSAPLDDYTSKNRPQEEDRYLKAFPFHPDLVDLFYSKWTQLEGFQQTRGILKTLATAIRDAESWDTQPLISAQAFLSSPEASGFSAAARELASTAQVEQYEGKSQNWSAILESELAHARKATEGFGSLKAREVEQAVIATFLHSQPIGQRATARELKLLASGGAPDAIELGKGLAHWADASWYLDDTFIDDREEGLPKLWRLGCKPNLKQMHHDARAQVADSQVDEVIEEQVRKSKKLIEGVRGAGAKLHMLPTHPSDIEDDGAFHFAVLGIKSASESGRPSAFAARFLNETTGTDKPRARNRNAVVLAAPSREGVEVAREKVRDLLGWERVRELLEKRDDVDAHSRARLEGNVRTATNDMASQVLLAWCICVTLMEDNKVAAFRVGADNSPLFARLCADQRTRIESVAVNAEALLPGGPYDLWGESDEARYVKDLVGAFAATARLPKMLNQQAILDTLLQGCESGDFVLRVTRSDKSSRTFWRNRPDDTALAEPSLEVVLPDKTKLTELEPRLLAPGALPELWPELCKETSLDMSTLSAYFSGEHLVSIEKGSYTEPQIVPALNEHALKESVTQAVASGHIWLVNGTISVFGEEPPAGFVNDQAALYPPPEPLNAADLLPEKIESAWSDEGTSAALIQAALSSKDGRPLPWPLVRDALDNGFRLGLFERTPDSALWPCDAGGASAIKIQVGAAKPGDATDATKATSKLESHEIQDLADEIDGLLEVAAGHTLRFEVTIHVGDEEAVDAMTKGRMNEVLGKIKSGWRVN